MVQHLNDVRTNVQFSWPFPHSTKMTAAVPAIMSTFDAGKKRKGWSQLSFLLIGEKYFPRNAYKDFCWDLNGQN